MNSPGALNLTLISGFLGAGKTTLVTELLRRGYPGEKLAVLVNDFGKLAIDASLIQTAGENMIELRDGCICCSLQYHLQTGLEKLGAQHRFDRVILETSGVSNTEHLLAILGEWQKERTLRIDQVIAAADMNTKGGDDYAARVYLSFDIVPDQLSFGTRVKLSLGRSIFGSQVPDAAVNYVWDNKHAIDTLQDNAYTDRARMLVLRSGNGKAGGWVQERRNVLADLQRAFGDTEAKGAKLSGLAIATDTDNTGGEAHAGFADFRFVANTAECAEPTPN